MISTKDAAREIGYAEIADLPTGIEKAALYAVAGLLISGQSHHKQWILEKVLESLGVNIPELKVIIKKQGYEFEKGIAP